MKYKTRKGTCECSTYQSNHRHCRGYKFITINRINYCILHARHYYLKYINIIQSNYRNYRIRRSINIYKKIPYDLQMKVLFHMQENDLIFKFHHTVIRNKILTKRDNYEEPYVTFIGDNIHSQIMADLFNNGQPLYGKITFYIKSILYLYEKYHIVFTRNDHLHLCTTVNSLYFIIMENMVNRIKDSIHDTEYIASVYNYLTQIKNAINDYYTYTIEHSKYSNLYDINLYAITLA